jgi:hypothetical protein
MHLDQFNNFYAAIESWGDIKKVEDKMTVQLNETMQKQFVCSQENDNFAQTNRILTDERDKYLK